MSRIGKKPIIIPSGVDMKCDGAKVVVKGAKGTLTCELHPQVALEIADNEAKVTVKNFEDHRQNALWGLFRSLIQNMVVGVTTGYEKKLEINGVGFKAAASGRKLILNVGFSHPVEFILPEGINCAVEKNVIVISGIDKQLVGQTAATIRKIKKPEPYLGKGIKYLEEVLRKKEGKKAAK